MDEKRVKQLVQDINLMTPEQCIREIAGIKRTIEEIHVDKLEAETQIEFLEETLKRLEK